MKPLFETHIAGAAELYTRMHADVAFNSGLERAADVVIETVAAGNTLFIAGNGGSAGEAQHFAAEITGRYKKERRGLPAIALTTDTSALTAIGNDYGFEKIFSRQLEALGSPGDVLVLLSTSGNSENLLHAARYAKSNRIRSIALLGKGGGKLADLVDVAVVVPSDDTARIQEAHLLIIHALSELIDERCSS